MKYRVALLLTVLSFVTVVAKENCSEKLDRPNVIFIYADDLGKGMLSVYGQKYFSTPNIDKLVQRGISFNNSYGGSGSAPARASMLTGYHDCNRDKWRICSGGKFLRYTDERYIAKLEELMNERAIKLPENDLYLPQVFKQAGYVTGQVGKLGWGFTSTRQQMKDHGWDYYYGYLDHVRSNGYYPPYLFENGKIVHIKGNTRQDCGKTIEPETPEAYAQRHDMKGKKVYSQDLFLDKILGFINKNKENPFFLYHPTQLPHGPVAASQVYEELANNSNLTAIEKEYASMVKMLDIHVGVIVEEIEKLGLADNTIFVFSSDNGHEIYYAQEGRSYKPYKNIETGELFDDYTNKYYSAISGDVFNGNASMAGMKQSNLQGGVNVPLTFYCKGKFDGRVSNQLVANYDLIPTFAEMLNIKLLHDKDGVSLWSILSNDALLDQERYVIFDSKFGPAIVENSGWKLRSYKQKNVYELFYLKTDPQEKNSLINSNCDVAERLKKILLEESKDVL